MSPWSVHFGWPDGDVYGNLIASGICAGLVYWRARIHLRREVARHAEQHARTHVLLEQLHEHLGIGAPEGGKR